MTFEGVGRLGDGVGSVGRVVLGAAVLQRRLRDVELVACPGR